MLVLASASPRRRELLALLGIPFSICAADIDERRLPDEAAAAHVGRLARQKAAAIAGRPEFASATVLGADTIVVCDDEVLGKPDDAAAARAMLTQLGGRWHEVMTAIAVLGPAGQDEVLCLSQVAFAPLSEFTINAYIATGEGVDKAGAYAIQGLGGALVRELRGSYSAVVGLPLFETRQLLLRHGLSGTLGAAS
jgi:septum formation protein